MASIATQDTPTLRGTFSRTTASCGENRIFPETTRVGHSVPLPQGLARPLVGAPHPDEHRKPISTNTPRAGGCSGRVRKRSPGVVRARSESSHGPGKGRVPYRCSPRPVRAGVRVRRRDRVSNLALGGSAQGAKRRARHTQRANPGPTGGCQAPSRGKTRQVAASCAP